MMQLERSLSVDDRLISLLTRDPVPGCSGREVFNQYRHTHDEHDLPDAPEIRLQNLRQYLGTIGGGAGVLYILVAEAAGYQGCRFSGIPMTSEAQLVGPGRLHWAREQEYRRSSARDRPWREPSATILWETLGERTDCLIWNAFPWHPIGKRGPLSNRRPRASEVAAGAEVLRCLLERYPAAVPVAVGRVAEQMLQELGRDPLYVRHPAHGGKREFVAGIRSLSLI